MSEWRRTVAASPVLIVATPDSAITPAAQLLRGLGTVTASHIVLHLSGLHDRTALSPLLDTGAALGSLHPLQAVSDPGTAAARLAGAYAGVEGDARAIECAERLARAAGMIPVRLLPAAKPGYHAAAAITSNLTVALYSLALRVATEAGVPADDAGRMYLGLLRGTVENLAAGSVTEALTGAIRRGDAETVRAHLRALAPRDRTIYRLLGIEALEVARDAGLPEDAVSAVRQALEDGR